LQPSFRDGDHVFTFNIYPKRIRLVDAQGAAVTRYLQQEIKPLLQEAQTRERQVLEQVSMVAASNHVLYDNNLLECKRQDEIRAFRALLPVDKNNRSDEDDATLDLFESENCDE
jgi:hypothetical protein